LFTRIGRLRGVFVNPTWLTAVAWVVGIVFAALNAWLLGQTIGGWLAG